MLQRTGQSAVRITRPLQQLWYKKMIAKIYDSPYQNSGSEKRQTFHLLHKTLPAKAWYNKETAYLPSSVHASYCMAAICTHIFIRENPRPASSTK